MRFLFRKFLNLPKWSGKLFTESSKFENLMHEKDFWNIIEDTRKLSKRNYKRQCIILTEYLGSLTQKEILSFNRTFQLLMAESYSFKLWEPVYSLNGGCSDDCFEYFRTWLIAQGKNNFYGVIQNPRYMYFICVKELIENYEGIGSCPQEAYENKTGMALPQTHDIFYKDPGQIFDEGRAFLHYPELALLAW